MAFRSVGIAMGIAVLVANNCFALSEEDYLKSINAEASKLSEPSRPAIPDKEAVEANKDFAQTTQPEFEALLKAKHRGTYSFYESLLEKDKVEVYEAFVDGASMRKIRGMIIDRKMHR
ncbi:MAG TPA: hypothetical protein ENG92_04590 [Thiolapillus brandeum]|uniref:Uncharacterized protein n=1 Tax=Thiolapillus brandeum TaxID=1076588 RepID=A0A831NW19_9GAMM|nr:hypothetical protein [Thiolapillus brandeum]